MKSVQSYIKVTILRGFASTYHLPLAVARSCTVIQYSGSMPGNRENLPFIKNLFEAHFAKFALTINSL